jgi:hypothetical protein
MTIKRTLSIIRSYTKSLELGKTSLTKLLPNKPKQTTPLGRWCHLHYSPSCDINKKVDLANQDNSL